MFVWAKIFEPWSEMGSIDFAMTLLMGDVVIMDNLSSHKVAGVREANEAENAQTNV